MRLLIHDTSVETLFNISNGQYILPHQLAPLTIGNCILHLRNFALGSEAGTGLVRKAVWLSPEGTSLEDHALRTTLAMPELKGFCQYNELITLFKESSTLRGEWFERISNPEKYLPKEQFDLIQRHLYSYSYGLKKKAICPVPNQYKEFSLLGVRFHIDLEKVVEFQRGLSMLIPSARPLEIGRAAAIPPYAIIRAEIFFDKRKEDQMHAAHDVARYIRENSEINATAQPVPVREIEAAVARRGLNSQCMQVYNKGNRIPNTEEIILDTVKHYKNMIASGAPFLGVEIISHPINFGNHMYYNSLSRIAQGFGIRNNAIIYGAANYIYSL